MPTLTQDKHAEGHLHWWVTGATVTIPTTDPQTQQTQCHHGHLPTHLQSQPPQPCKLVTGMTSLGNLFRSRPTLPIRSRDRQKSIGRYLTPGNCDGAGAEGRKVTLYSAETAGTWFAHILAEEIERCRVRRQLIMSGIYSQIKVWFCRAASWWVESFPAQVLQSDQMMRKSKDVWPYITRRTAMDMRERRTGHQKNYRYYRMRNAANAN